MENSSNSSYPDSGDSSPRSREVEFEIPPPWEDSQGNQAQMNYKVKFMCSYGGKIHPRPQDNQLFYLGGDTKILAVDRGIKFDALLAKLNSLCDENASFKYQLPGEDLDALISVTNDDDLEHLMHEYDRLCRVSQKPARLRIFSFSAKRRLASSDRILSSDEAKSEKERFVQGLNVAPTKTAPLKPAAPPKTAAPPKPPITNADFLFGSEKENAMANNNALYKPEVEVSVEDEKLVGLDLIEKHHQDLQRVKLEEEQGTYRRKTDDYLSGGEYYNVAEKFSPATFQGGFSNWMDNNIHGGVFHGNNLNTEQPIYMISSPASAYQAQMVRPPTGLPPPQAYFTFSSTPLEIYSTQQQLYNLTPRATAQQAPSPQMASLYSETTTGGAGMVTESGAYAQVAYDRGMERQVIYTVLGSPVPATAQSADHYSPLAGGIGADMRPDGALNQETGGKPASKDDVSI